MIMSQEEKDLILGRLVRENREAAQDVAVVEARLASYSEALMDASYTINGAYTPPFVEKMPGVLSQFDTLPTKAMIVDALELLQKAKDRAATVKARLDAVA